MELTTILQVLYRFYRYYTDFEVTIFPATVSIKLVYFILSSEINVYPKQIKVILSTVKNIVFSLVTDSIYVFITVTNRGCFDNLGLHFFPKRSGMHPSCLTLSYGRKRSNEGTEVWVQYVFTCTPNIKPTQSGLPSKINKK